tara:strand:+ start:491 stop:1567 length:1077 start_codon:yes stop_codon:yes gene_type:complete
MRINIDLQKIVDHAKNLDMDFVKFTEWLNESSVSENDKDELMRLFEQDGVRKVDFVDGITDKDIIPDRTPPEDDVEEMSGDMAYRAMDKAEKKSRGEMSVSDPEKAKKKARQAQKFADYSIKKTLNKEEVELDESPVLQMKMAADDIETYAIKHGGIDKKDMMKTASMLKKGNKKGALKFIKTLDTDPRDYLLKTMGEEVTVEDVDKYESMYISRVVKNKKEKIIDEENRGPRTDAEKKAHLDKIFKHIDNVRKKKEAKLGFKITDVTPKGYGPTDEAKDDPCEETNLERLKKTWAVHKFKKGGGKIEKQPEGDAYNAMKWRGKTHSTRDEDQEDERARKVMDYRKKLRDIKKAKKKK